MNTNEPVAGVLGRSVASPLTVTMDIDWPGTAPELEAAVREAFGALTRRLVVVDPDNRSALEAPYLAFASLENSEGGPSREGSVEVDRNALVSMSGDGGAYVSAWIWVWDEDAGVSRTEDGDAGTSDE